MWPKSVQNLLSLLKIQVPVIQAPMAGGLTTPSLVAAVSNAGGLGSIGGALMTPENLQAAVQSTRRLTEKPFSVNLFAPLKTEQSKEKIEKSFERMAAYRRVLNIDKDAKPQINPAPVFEDQLNLLIREKIPVVSFTFGTPSAEWVRKLRDHQITVIGTANTVREAIELENLGYNAIVAQGSEAGGHRGAFIGGFESSLIGLMALVPAMVDHVKLPVIASGGIMDGRGLAAALCLGACAAQMGTAFLTCPEAGVHPQYREAILKSNEESTAITSVFTGRPARAIRNQFVEEMSKYKDILPDYPLQQSLTSPIRKKAAEDNRAEFMSMWAGQGTRLSQSVPAAQLVQNVVAQALSILKN